MLNILISDYSNNLVELIFKEIIRKNNNFRLADYTYNKEDTLNSILQYRPNVIILDETTPKMKANSIIGYMSSIKNEYFPYTIAVGNDEEYLNEIRKNKDIYAIVNAKEGVTNILENIKKHLEEIYEEISNKEIYNKIKKELKNFKLNISNKGTSYLIDSILLSYNNEELNFTRDVYPILSKKYNVTPMNIKWNMEKNIKSMKRYTDDNVITEYFNIDNKSNLTIKTVVTTVAENIEKTAYNKQSKL